MKLKEYAACINTLLNEKKFMGDLEVVFFDYHSDLAEPVCESPEAGFMYESGAYKCNDAGEINCVCVN